LFPVIFVAGVAIAPTLITGYSLIDHLAPPERRTECMTWLSSAIGVGLAIGAPAAGRLIDLSGARAGYLLPAASGTAAFVTVPPPPPPPPPRPAAARPPAVPHSCGQD